ncbi:MAG TPA: ATP-binding cassette domain-containing protein [Pseudonocardiaceae bacterium]
MERPRIEVVGLGKSFGAVDALTDITFKVGAGMVLGVLGHNGAGKTTLTDILATRSRPTTGTAKVCGFDVVKRGDKVRERIGMTSQFVAVDDNMSGRDNLILLARLLGASPRQAKARADELLEAFDLVAAANRKSATYSGGMRRRLDLAASLLSRPDVLFLDEPSTGLDPASRSDVWGFVQRLAADGTTVFLTTQYLEEADQLAHYVLVLAFGRVIASGTPDQLKTGIGKRQVTVTLPSSHATFYAAAALTRERLQPLVDAKERTVTVPIPDAGDIASVVRVLDVANVPIRDLKVTEPSLNDVYMALHRSGWNAQAAGSAS